MRRAATWFVLVSMLLLVPGARAERAADATRAAAAAADAARDAAVRGLVGAWGGRAVASPLGPMRFGFVFEKAADGRIAGTSVLNSETWFELSFARGADGRWTGEEAGGLEGIGVQRHHLVPVEAADGAEAGVFRWVTEGEPQLLRLDVAAHGNELSLKAWVRGALHADLALERLNEADARALAERFAAARRTPPGPGTSIADFAKATAAAAAAPDGPLARARAQAAAAPSDITAQLALARLLLNAIAADPMAGGPRYGFELKEVLEHAVTIEPPAPEAFEWLAGYYLNAPPIAGGSLDKAEAVAAKLAAFDAAAAARVRARIAAARSKDGTKTR